MTLDLVKTRYKLYLGLFHSEHCAKMCFMHRLALSYLCLYFQLKSVNKKRTASGFRKLLDPRMLFLLKINEGKLVLLCSVESEMSMNHKKG